MASQSSGVALANQGSTHAREEALQVTSQAGRMETKNNLWHDRVFSMKSDDSAHALSASMTARQKLHRCETTPTSMRLDKPVAEICRETNDDGDSIHVCMMRGSLTTSVQTTLVFGLIVHRLHLPHAIISRALSSIVEYS